MLRPVADAVSVHVSEFLLSNAVVVQGPDGVLLVDPGVTGDELACLAGDLTGRRVTVGFSTHPHWDHLLWHEGLGEATRYGTARCAASARDQLDPQTQAEIVEHLDGTGIEDRMSLDRFGLVTALPDNATHVPWDGPAVRILEHQGHAPGAAALLIEDRGVLIAGDLLSDVLPPMPDFSADDPFGDHLAALDLLETVAGDVETLIPGHGNPGGPGETVSRIALDRAYVEALRDGRPVSDPRIGDRAPEGWEWVTGIYDGQLEHLAGRS